MSPLKDFPELTDVSKPYELMSQVPVYFAQKEDSKTKFYFTVSEEMVVKIDVWPLDLKSDPDMYVKIDDDTVDEKNNEWR